MTKGYIIEQVIRVLDMMRTHQNTVNKEFCKQYGNNIKTLKEIGYTPNTEITDSASLLVYKAVKHRNLESATKTTLLNLLEELVELGFNKEVKGFDNNFTY